MKGATAGKSRERESGRIRSGGLPSKGSTLPGDQGSPGKGSCGFTDYS